MIKGVLAYQIPEQLSEIRSFLDKFEKISHGRVSSDLLLKDLLMRDRQLWVINDYQAVCLTSVQHDTVCIDFCAGVRAKEWQGELENKIREWGRKLGKKKVVATGRKGWEKFGNTRGFKEVGRVYVSEI